jgi:hypothetical protein
VRERMDVRRRVVNTNRRSARRVTLSGLAVSFGVATVFLGFGAFVSVLAPVHEVTLRREVRQSVRADISQLLLLVVPMRRETVARVTGVSVRIYAAPPSLEPGRNPADAVRPEREGFLVLESDSRHLDIPASPSDVYSLERAARDFLAGHEPVLRLRIVSNWKVGVVAVVLVALPGLLILIGIARDAASWRRRRS